MFQSTIIKKTHHYSHSKVTTLISVISLFKSNIEDTGESISETINEAAQKSKEQADASKEELDSLTELIAKYKELAKSTMQDASTMQEIAEIQSEIVGLVGGQVEGLDLVNGKLEEQYGILRKIKYIELGDTVSDYEKAYTDAHNTTEKYDKHNGNALGDWGEKNNVITFDYKGGDADRDKGIEIVNDVWSEKGYGSAKVAIYTRTEDTYSSLEFDKNLKYPEWVEALDAAIDALENTEGYDYSNSKFWSKLIKIRSDLKIMLSAVKSRGAWLCQ